MVVIFILFILLLLSYVAAVSFKSFSIPGSISASFYALKHKWWFRFTMWLSPVLLFISMVDASSINSQFALYLAMLGMVMVGCSPNYKVDVHEKRLHISGATITLVFSQVWVLMNAPVSLLIWIPFAVYTLLYTLLKHKGYPLNYRFMKSKPMFWTEITAIAAVICSGFIMLFK